MKKIALLILFISNNLFSLEKDDILLERKQVLEKVEENFQKFIHKELYLNLLNNISVIYNPLFIKETILPMVVDGILEVEGEVKAFVSKHPELADSEVISIAISSFSKEELEEFINDFCYALIKSFSSNSPEYVSIRNLFMECVLKNLLMEELEEDHSVELLNLAKDCLTEDLMVKLVENIEKSSDATLQRLYANFYSFDERYSYFDLEEINKLYPNNAIQDKCEQLLVDGVLKIISEADKKRAELDLSIDLYFRK